MHPYDILFQDLNVKLKEAAAEGDMDSMMDILNSMGKLLLTNDTDL